MADVAGATHLRQKKIRTYGKTYRRQAFEITNFNEDGVPDDSHDQQTRTITQSYPLQKLAVNASEVDSVRPAKPDRDAFDVPSSDDEATNAPRRLPTPNAPKLKRPLVDADTEEGSLAPWEHKKRKMGWSDNMMHGEGDHTEASTGEPASSWSRTASPSKTFPNRGSKIEPVAHVVIPVRPGQPLATTATGRLAARRQMMSKSAQSSADELAQPASRSHAKTSIAPSHSKLLVRARKVSRMPETTKSENDRDTLTPEDSEEGVSEGVMSNLRRSLPGTPDIYEVPANDREDRFKPDVRNRSPPVASHKLKGGKLASRSKRQATEKSSSAPTRLAEILPSDAESPEPPSRSPSLAALDVTTDPLGDNPQQSDAPRTPPDWDFTPDDAVRNGAMTPRQAEIWSKLDLLSSDMAVPSPSALHLQDLTLSARRRTPPSHIRSSTLSKAEHAQRRRSRLVDRLKQSVPPSSDDESSNGESEELQSHGEDTNMTDTTELVACAPPSTSFDSQATEQGNGPVQSQASSDAQAHKNEAGPRITYGKMRSYLAEDDIAEGLLMDLPLATPQRASASARRTARSRTASQPSGFDVEDSDDEGGTGQLRSIHELRAAGRNRRMMQDLDALLSEICDHSLSARNRRRNALLELGTKLTDKIYAERLAGHGAERQLASECSIENDEVTAFLLAGCIVLILIADPTEHTAIGLFRAGLMDSLVKMLAYGTNCSEFAKDRSNNLSKSAQTAITQFAGQLDASGRVRNHNSPISLSTRLLALKALDLLIGRLRRSGERSELLQHHQVQAVVDIADDKVETATAISILEALSTTAALLQWPVAVLNKLSRAVPARVPDDKASRHTCFLTLRLFMNLTNESFENCEAIAADHVVANLLCLIRDGFAALAATSPNDTENWAMTLDQVVLATGIMINLAEHNSRARGLTANDEGGASIASLVAIFKEGQKRMLEAESVEESTSNVAYGYLAVLLANLCQSSAARTAIAGHLPSQSLAALVEAVEEFVVHHQRVDTMSFEGEEGKEVWSAFTEKLKAVLKKLKAVAI